MQPAVFCYTRAELITSDKSNRESHAMRNGAEPAWILNSARTQQIALISIVLSYLAAKGVSAPLPIVFASFVVFSYVVISSGQLVLRAAQASDLPLITAWPLGVTATAVGLLVLVSLLPITAAVAFAAWAAAIIPIDIATAKRRKPESGFDRTDLISLILCCAFTIVWCKDLAEVPVVLANTGRLPAWSDYLLHAGTISQFGDQRAIGHGAIWLADMPWTLYHYASYTLPAAFASPLDQPGLPLATSVWVPIGLLALAAAAYTLGTALAGVAGGIAALMALFVLPDASSYGLRNGFFSFHWGLFAIPTTSYALSSALLAAVFLQRWVTTRSRLAFAISAALVLATALFRVHVFILLFPAWLVVVAVASRTVQRRRVLFLALAGVLVIGAVLVLRFGPQLPAQVTWVFDEGWALERFLYFVHRRQEPTGYQGLYQRISESLGETIGFAAGVVLVYPACLGLLVILYPLALVLLRGRLRWGGIDALPFALLIAYAAVMTLAPAAAHHEATEFPHRPFVLLYALLAVWTAASLVRWLAGQAQHGMRLWQTLVICSVLALPFLWVDAAAITRPKFFWGRQFTSHVVDLDLIRAADALRSNARPSDIFATAEVPIAQVSVDAPTELVALSGVPSYLARFWIYEAQGGAARSSAVRRLAALREVAHASNVDSAMRRLRELRVRWYVVTQLREPRWDPQRSRAIWVRGGFAIYDAGPVPDGR